MTGYSKICPKCQNSCDLAALSCKKCGLKFGVQPVEADATPEPKEPILRKPETAVIVFGILGVILLIGIVGFVLGFMREQRQHEIQIKDTAAHVKTHVGKD